MEIVHRERRYDVLLKRAKMVSLAIACAAATIPVSAGAATPGTSTAVPVGVDAAALAGTRVGPVVAVGRLTNKAGQPTAGRVSAQAWPSEQFQRSLSVGAQFTTPTVGTATAANDGAFSLRVDPAKVPAGYRSPGGQVNLNLVAWAGGSQGETNMSVQLAPGRTAAATGAAAPVQSKAVTLRLDRPLASAPTQGARSATVAVPNAVGCWTYWVLLSTNDVWTHAGETYAYHGGTTAGFDMSSGNSLSLGVAFSGSGRWGTFSPSGSYTISSSVEYHWLASNAFLEYDVQTRYGRYGLRSTCGTGYYQYRESPMYDTGGNRTIGTGYPNWWNCVPMSGNFRWQRNWSSGYHYSIGGGVNLYGVIGTNLSIDTAWSGSYDVWYQFTYPSYLCGSNAVPSQASRVEEG